jgi:hypothetical protein
MMRILVLGGLLAFGCSSTDLVNSPADAAATDASTDFDGAGDPAWTCLGKVTFPPATVFTVRVDFTSIETLSNKPLVGAEVKACARTDTTCASALGMATTDEKGLVSFTTLPAGTNGFDGYFAVTPPNDGTNLNFISPPMTADVRNYLRVYWGYASLSLLFSTAGITQRAGRGIIGIEAHDCGEIRDGKPCVGHARAASLGSAWESRSRSTSPILRSRSPTSIPRAAS